MVAIRDSRDVESEGVCKQHAACRHGRIKCTQRLVGSLGAQANQDQSRVALTENGQDVLQDGDDCHVQHDPGRHCQAIPLVGLQVVGVIF